MLGATVKATAINRAGQEIAQCKFVAPPFGETRTLRMEPNVSFCRVDGRVITADGASAKARLVIGENKRRGNSIHRARASTDDDGRFRLRLVATGEDVEVRVASDGNALLRERLSLVEGAQEPWYTVHPGHELTARLVGQDGKTLDVAIKAAQQSELGIESEQLPDMSTQLRRLPAGELTLRASYASRTFVQRVDASTHKGTVVMHAPRPEQVPLRVAAHIAPDTVLSLAIVSGNRDRRLSAIAGRPAYRHKCSSPRFRNARMHRPRADRTAARSIRSRLAVLAA